LNVEDAKVIVDGNAVPASGRSVEIVVTTDGDHDLEVSAPGRKTEKQVVVVSGGATVKLELALDRATRSTKQTKPDRPATKSDKPKPKPTTRDTDYTIDPFKKSR
jgi:hypothetical protein